MGRIKSNWINATNVNFHLLGQAIWGYIWKHTVKKRQTNATSVTFHFLILVNCENTQEFTKKSQTKMKKLSINSVYYLISLKALFVNTNAKSEIRSTRLRKPANLLEEKSIKCKQCDCASAEASYLKIHLKTKIGETGPMQLHTLSGTLRTHVKTYIGDKFSVVGEHSLLVF